MASRPKSPDELVDQVRAILSESAADNARLATQLSEFVREVSSELGQGRRIDAAELFSRWVDFNLQSYSLVSKQSAALLDGLLSVARATLLPSGTTPQPTRPEQRLELRMSGHVGERVSTSFVIENQFDQQLDVAFECDDLVSTTGASQAQPASLVDFTPQKLSIPPRNQAVGQVGVTLKGEFVAGETYTTTIRLLGFPTKELRLLLTVLPPQDAPPAAATALAAPRTRRTSRRRGPTQR
jgi:hypothetical protein